MALFLFHPSSLNELRGWLRKLEGGWECNSRGRGINGEDKLEVWAEMARSWLRDFIRWRDCWWRETVFLLLRFEIIVLPLSLRLWWFWSPRAELRWNEKSPGKGVRTSQRNRSCVTVIDIYKWSLHFHPRLWQSVSTLWNLLVELKWKIRNDP